MSSSQGVSSGRSPSMAESIISMCRHTWPSMAGIIISKCRRTWPSMAGIIISKCRRTWPSMAESIISKCSRTWSRESRIGVLLRTTEPEVTFTVWDCVPECVIDGNLKDAFEYHSEQRDYLLHYAVPASAILRSIRRLDGYRASPLVLKSLHFFDHQEEIDAYNFPPEFTEYFSESEYDEDSFISRESTLSPTPVSELDDSDVHTTTQIYNSKSKDEAELEDELVRCKPQQWIEHPESKAFEVCIAPLQESASDVDDEASGPEPRQLPDGPQVSEFDDSDIHTTTQTYNLKSEDEAELDDELVRCKPQQWIDHPESEAFEVCIAPLQESASDVDDKAYSPEPRLLPDEPLEANNPDPRPLLPEVYPFYPVSNDGEEDVLLTEECPEPREFTDVPQLYFQSDHGQWSDESFGSEYADPRHAFREQFRGVYQFHSVFVDTDDEEEEEEEDERYQESHETRDPKPQRIVPVHQSHPRLYEPEPRLELDLEGPESLEIWNLY